MKGTARGWTGVGLRLGLLGSLVLVPAAPGAADVAPSRCIARWQGPVEGCSLREPISTEGLGSSEHGAGRQARRNLAAALEAARMAKAASLPPGAREQFLAESTRCVELGPPVASVTCFPEPHLRTVRYCSLELPSGPCALSQGFVLQGRPWATGEAARERICGQPDDATLLLDPAAAACRAACWAQGRLKCGTSQ